MKTIAELIENIPVEKVFYQHDKPISHLAHDSREIKESGLFFAIKGENTDGHHHIDGAIENGALAIICEDLPVHMNEGICYVQVKNPRAVVGHVADVFYDQPSQKLRLVGLTGTNGKTTTASLLYQIFSHLGHKVGFVSTIENRIGKKVIERNSDVPSTTPDALSLHKLFRMMVDEGCEYCFMEVSSHALDQNRTAGVHFTGAVFTNITHDHIDYHGTFEAYLMSKRQLFDMLPEGAFCLSNYDDDNGKFMLQNSVAAKYSYGLGKGSDYDCDIVRNEIDGLALTINEGPIISAPLVGVYNAYNLTAAYGTAALLGVSDTDLKKTFPHLSAPAGRFQIITDSTSSIVGIVDYAHTPDGVEQVLQTINDVAFDDRKIVVVIGSGGDRDPSKRALMGRHAYTLSNLAIFTSDNPRSEEPLAIIDDMVSGILDRNPNRLVIDPDRASAIHTAVEMAGENGVVVLLGKGHETYQEIKGEKIPFDDRKYLLQAMLAE